MKNIYVLIAVLASFAMAFPAETVELEVNPSNSAWPLFAIGVNWNLLIYRLEHG